MGDLTAFLQDASLSAYEPQLTALGVAVPADIGDVEGAFHKAARDMDTGRREGGRERSPAPT